MTHHAKENICLLIRRYIQVHANMTHFRNMQISNNHHWNADKLHTQCTECTESIVASALQLYLLKLSHRGGHLLRKQEIWPQIDIIQGTTPGQGRPRKWWDDNK